MCVTLLVSYMTFHKYLCASLFNYAINAFHIIKVTMSNTSLHIETEMAMSLAMVEMRYIYLSRWIT